ncbi:MAG: Small subunit (SSU) processome component [Chrysothrix sp. TS-e1954]|nr:MAG: Small subunit (SSU) processome component [Chrysothrix sp. TS-e1954]
MSHAANLRHRQHASTASAKRRKLSSDSARPQINGYHDSSASLVGKKFEAIPSSDAKAQARAKLEEVSATISRGDEDVEMRGVPNGIIHGSSGDDPESADEVDDDDDEDEDEDEKDAEAGQEEGKMLTPVSKDLPYRSEADTDSAPVPVTGDEADEDESHVEDLETFGDLLEKQNGETRYIDTTTNDDQDQSKDLVGAPNRTLSVPTATSLGTVLTQALRTDDAELLESCLQVPNLDSIRATIERLHSSLAASLLQKLAERMHRRPGRAGSLMVWIQWTIVAHGGYLAGQPAAMKQLQTLYQVVKQRATSLQPLLALKGKLDMLEAQLQLRRSRQAAPSRAGEIDQGVIYVEGEEDDSEADAEAPESTNKISDASSLTRNNRKRRLPSPSLDGESDNESDMGLLANGVSEEEDAEPEDEEDSDDNLIDDEADVTSADSDEIGSEEINYSDADDASSGEDERPIPKSNKSKSRPTK